MNSYAVLALFIAGISNFSGTEAFITDQIIGIFEDASQSIKDNGLDPLYIQSESGYYALPVPVIFNAAGYCEEVLSTGLSDFIINDMHYDLIGFRLTFEIEIPHIHLSVGSAVGEAVIFDNKLFAEGSGSIDIYKPRVRGDVRIGILGGISARAINIDASILSIDSNVKLNIMGYDLSDLFNYFLEETVMGKLEDFKPEVDELIAIFLMDYINENVLN